MLRQAVPRRLPRLSRYADRLPIGTRESLRPAPRARRCVRFYHDWYRPDLMAVVAVGDFDAGARSRRSIRERFAAIPAAAAARERRRTSPSRATRSRWSRVATDPEATYQRR